MFHSQLSWMCAGGPFPASSDVCRGFPLSAVSVVCRERSRKPWVRATMFRLLVNLDVRRGGPFSLVLDVCREVLFSVALGVCIGSSIPDTFRCAHGGSTLGGVICAQGGSTHGSSGCLLRCSILIYFGCGCGVLLFFFLCVHRVSARGNFGRVQSFDGSWPRWVCREVPFPVTLHGCMGGPILGNLF